MAGKGASEAWVHVDELSMWEGNPRLNDGRPTTEVAASIRRFGFVAPVVVWTSQRRVVAGHTRIKALRAILADTPGFVPQGAPAPGMVPVRWYEFASEAEANAYALADNRLGELAQWDDAALAELLKGLGEAEVPLENMGWDSKEIEALLNREHEAAPVSGHARLSDMFGVPPFSVLDARQGYWQDRKRAWLSLGLRSEDGRSDALTYGGAKGKDIVSQRIMKSGGGTSIFDPVLCELLLRWFCPAGGSVLDPFSGGSVRGVISAALEHPYIGVDVREVQVRANEAQWNGLHGVLRDVFLGERPDSMLQYTPVQLVDGVWFKRDDTFCVGGVAGGKVRTCWALAQGATGLVTAGSRASPQVNIVAHVARKLGIPCRVHVPSGELSSEVQAAQAAGAEVVQHRPGYNSVIVARAREDAQSMGWREIPFGMECEEAPRQTRTQVANIPAEVKRIVIPVGSGMSLAGVLWGLVDAGRKLPVLGVVVDADPTERLDRYAPPQWRTMVELVPSGTKYEKPASVTELHGIHLDPHYEAKCIQHVREGDLFWIVGVRQTEDWQRTASREVPVPRWLVGDSRDLPQLLTEDERADFILSCPPYGDLEVYSQEDGDISRLNYDEFVKAYQQIVRHAVARLRDNRFAAWVVGDFRDARGFYRNFVADTISAFHAVGAYLYNDAILVTPVGSLPLRTGRQFRASRKLGKTHQNVLVFFKGNPTTENIQEALGTLRANFVLPEAPEDAEE